MDQDIPHNEIIIEVRGNVGVVTLNRPQSLNALSLDMIREIASALNKWKDDKGVHAVVFKGTGDKAFCAGGDIKTFYSAGMDLRKGAVSERVPLVFFGEEYALNRQIFNYPKPTVSLMTGITMGGGYGIAGHCNLRITSANTVMAMPEVKIGFFPDIGGMYHLEQCPHNYGRYLALTGAQIDGKLTATLGLADVYLEQVDEDKVLKAVQDNAAAKDFRQTMTQVVGTADFGVEVPHAALIEKAFQGTNIQSILKALEDDGTSHAADIFEDIHVVSPTSVRVVCEYLTRLNEMSFDDVIAQDFTLVQTFIKQPDMYEGIRAKLIDKDNNPKWMPDKLKDVSEEAVKEYFTPTGYDLNDVEVF